MEKKKVRSVRRFPALVLCRTICGFIVGTGMKTKSNQNKGVKLSFSKVVSFIVCAQKVCIRLDLASFFFFFVFLFLFSSFRYWFGFWRQGYVIPLWYTFALFNLPFRVVFQSDFIFLFYLTRSCFLVLIPYEVSLSLSLTDLLLFALC